MASVARLVTDTAARLILTAATVGSVTEHDRFRTIELVGEQLTGTDWVPGDKLRIHVDGLALRTYTPMSWDGPGGSTRLLAYLPGDGPGATWCEQARPGDTCAFLGPRRSVRLDHFDAPPVFVGDETSFGLLLAWHHLHPGSVPAAAIFEVDRADVARAVLDAHGAGPGDAFERSAGDAHLGALEDRVVDAVRSNPAALLCLTGRARTIAAVRRRVKAEGLTRRDATVKAYWDQNRKGLD